MNKQAARLKRKRRNERRAAEASKNQNIIDDVNAYRASIGKPPADGKLIMALFKKRSREYAVNGTEYPIFVTMYMLNKLHGFGRLRLYRYLMRTESFIGAVNRRERTEHQLRQEMFETIEVDVTETPDIGSVDNISPESKMLLYNCRNGLTFAFYYLYFDLRWGKKRIRDFHNAVVSELYDVVANNRISEIKSFLEKKCKMIFNDDKLSIKTPETVLRKRGELY
ncbi:MAG: hypothetical protein Q4G33_07840 [bacterium]|nr:hypothetical protein [bacterium]